jgi:hypothetical protein
MPNPSQVSAQNINTELGVSSTSSIRLSNNSVKNVASTGSTSNSNINFGKTRWGINTPGRSVQHNYPSGGFDEPQYDITDLLSVEGSDIQGTYDSFSTAQAAAIVTFFSNGVMKVTAFNSVQGDYDFHRTWLTSGVNSDYTVQFQVTDGALTGGSGSANTDLSLSSNRTFQVATVVLLGTSGDQSVFNNASGNLIIKSAGTTLISRPVSLYAEASLGSI